MTVLLLFLTLADAGTISSEEAKKLRNPVATEAKSIAAGKKIFVRMCSGCHGADGKPTIDGVAEARDLTNPMGFKGGASQGEIFRTIHEGFGEGMPAFKEDLKSHEEIWDLVNFVRSLWRER